MAVNKQSRTSKALAFAEVRYKKLGKRIAKMQKRALARELRQQEVDKTQPISFTTGTRNDINGYGRGGWTIRDVGVIKKRRR